MCQLTLIDIKPETKLAKATIRSLTEINSVGIIKESPQANEDGFGYMTFSKAPYISKSNKCAIDWWTENQDEFQKTVRNANGIYHVRSASRNIRTLHQKDAHPFNVGNVTVIHNGTLEETKELKDDKKLQKLFPVTKDDKNVVIPMIDSEKYARILAHVVGDNNRLKPEDLVNAMSYFTGSFALIVHDIKQPSKVFIARGKTKKLHQAIIYNGDEKIGLILNTGEWELFHWARIVKMIAKEYLGIKLKILVEELDEDSIYVYRIGSYKKLETCHEIKENRVIYRHVQRADTIPASQAGFRGPHHHHTSHTDIPAWKCVADLAMELNLSLRELMIISEITLGQCVHTLTPEKMDILLQILEELKNYDFGGRYKLWNKWLIEAEISSLYGYKVSGLDFPFMLTAKKGIKSKIKKVKLPPKKVKH